MEKVIAVIVSYNRHSQLSECIEAIRNQTRKPNTILVVNNGSSDYTTVWLDKQEDIQQIYQENTGSAGGYHAGITWGYVHDYTWIWCMGDDGYPKENALEILLQSEGPEIGLLNSAVINKEDKQSFVWKTNHYKKLVEVQEESIHGVAHLFNGTLIHRSIISKVGMPEKKLFIKGVEAEYFYRITKQFKIPAKTVSQSIYYHPADLSSFSKEWELKNAMTTYFYLRNQFAVFKSKHSFKVTAFIYYHIFIYKFITTIINTQRHQKIQKIGFAFWSFKDALFNNYSATPEIVKRKILSQYTHSIKSLVILPIKNFFLSVFVPSYFEAANTAKA